MNPLSVCSYDHLIISALVTGGVRAIMAQRDAMWFFVEKRSQREEYIISRRSAISAGGDGMTPITSNHISCSYQNAADGLMCHREELQGYLSC